MGLISYSLMPEALTEHQSIWGKYLLITFQKSSETVPVLQLVQQQLWIYFWLHWERPFQDTLTYISRNKNGLMGFQSAGQGSHKENKTLEMNHSGGLKPKVTWHFWPTSKILILFVHSFLSKTPKSTKKTWLDYELKRKKKYTVCQQGTSKEGMFCFYTCSHNCDSKPEHLPSSTGSIMCWLRRSWPFKWGHAALNECLLANVGRATASTNTIILEHGSD